MSWNHGDIYDGLARVVLPEAPGPKRCDGGGEAVRSFTWAEVESIGTDGRGDPPPPADGRRPALALEATPRQRPRIAADGMAEPLPVRQLSACPGP